MTEDSQLTSDHRELTTTQPPLSLSGAAQGPAFLHPGPAASPKWSGADPPNGSHRSLPDKERDFEWRAGAPNALPPGFHFGGGKAPPRPGLTPAGTSSPGWGRPARHLRVPHGPQKTRPG